VIAIAVVVIAAVVVLLRRSPAFVLGTSKDENVLLVTIDTLRADALSSYGGPAETPNLDRLAAGGARFTFAHAHAVVTLPSHTSILSGLLPYQHGMRDNSGFRVHADTPTLATRLKALGYDTGAFVGGFPVTKRFGLGRGFDAYDDQMPETRGGTEITMPERPATEVVARALAWIGQRQAKFFSWVHVYDPHSPYTPPPDLATRYSAQPYYGEVASVDRALGPLLDRLSSLSRPTLVIVTADHGESLGEHGEQTHGMFAYESTLRVPLIVARVVPGAGGSRGRVIAAPVRHIDIVPTVLDAVGAQADSSLPGRSLRDVIDLASTADRPSYFEAMTYNLVRGWAPLRGVLRDREKFIDLPIVELYDLASDPGEQQNRAPREAQRVDVMMNLLKTFDVAPPNRPGRESADAAAALRTLGYVSGAAAPKATYTEADDPKRLIDIDNDLHTATELTQSGRTDEAIALLERVIARRPDTADAYVTLAHDYWERGAPEQAIATLDRALASGAPDRDVRIRLGIYLAESHQDPARAIQVLEALPDEDVEGLNALGLAYGDAGRAADAVRVFKRVLALDSTNGLAYQNLAAIELREALQTADAQQKSARFGQAEANARQAIAVDPQLADAYTTLGVVLSSTARKPQAVEAWKQAVALDPGQFNALYNLWLELADAGRREEASAYGRQFVASAPPAFFAPDIARVRAYLRQQP
jgi:arylsulfatase A-like enzyme/cytochrome c-type biogenesis protein CcmH/NrfG